MVDFTLKENLLEYINRFKNDNLIDNFTINDIIFLDFLTLVKDIISSKSLPLVHVKRLISDSNIILDLHIPGKIFASKYCKNEKLIHDNLIEKRSYVQNSVEYLENNIDNLFPEEE